MWTTPVSRLLRCAQRRRRLMGVSPRPPGEPKKCVVVVRNTTTHHTTCTARTPVPNAPRNHAAQRTTLSRQVLPLQSPHSLLGTGADAGACISRAAPHRKKWRCFDERGCFPAKTHSACTSEAGIRAGEPTSRPADQTASRPDGQPISAVRCSTAWLTAWRRAASPRGGTA